MISVRFIAALTLVAATSTALAQDPPPPQPAPNTECGSEAQPFTTPEGGIEGTGRSNNSKERALENAIKDLERKLGAHSGIVCQICPDGLQCKRKIEYVDPTGPKLTSLDPYGPNGWEAKYSFDGNYKVSCKPCPSEE